MNVDTNLLHITNSGFYDSSKQLTETEILMKLIEKLNLIILNFNNLENITNKRLTEMEKQIQYYIDTGIKLEVTKQLEEMSKNGTLNELINGYL